MASTTSSPTEAPPPPAPWTSETLDVEMWSDLAPGRPLEAGGVECDEGVWKSDDQHELAWRAWYDGSAKEAPRGTVALMHGYAEHSGRYGHVAAALVRVGYCVIAIDARGHGKSSGRRGHIQRFEDYVDDLALLVRRGLERWPDRPLFVLGHSNGGLIALRHALRRPSDVAGYVVTSPLCKLAVPVPAVKEWLGRMASRHWPTLSIPSGLDAGYVSQIREVVDAYKRDPMVFSTTTARWFTEAQRAMAGLSDRAHRLDQAVLFLVAGSDRIVDPQATLRVFRGLASSDRELEVYDALYHEILNERPWREILRRAVLWMERRRPTRVHDPDI